MNPQNLTFAAAGWSHFVFS